MNHNPLVSVIIPTYNRASMIENAIKSVIGQKYPNKQIIVVDDGSEDDTASIVKQYRQVEYVLQSHAGQAVARNNGLRHAKGVYIASLDSDDVWNADFLEKCISCLEKEKIDFVFANWHQELEYGGVRDFLSSDPFLQPHFKNAKGAWIKLANPDLRYIYTNACPSPSSSAVIRASSIVSGWNEKMNIADDWCLFLDLILAKDCTAAFTMERLWLKHINCNNIFDGRNLIEVNRILYVTDTQTILSRYAGKLTKNEYKVIKKKYLENLVRSAKHSLFLYSNFGESMNFMKRAVSIDPLYSIKAFSKLFFESWKRRFRKIYR